jgi:hypothetical protein
VSVADAEQIRRTQEQQIRERLDSLVAVDDAREPDTATLLSHNLISGIASIDD